MEIVNFIQIAKHLTPPLILVGLAVYLGFSVHHKMLEKGVLSKPNAKDSGHLKYKILQYGFWLIVILAILGVGLAVFQIWMEGQQAKP
ncbi:hypothetical protein [Desulfogranum marinum]|uniref:hypothetical protein n=1 Tax=Desulfogranum marinum TaxID=453220 RepID=UPI0019629EA3|nr:hypothetical protein [Desulfogranum marinum]MBM9511257.1 hypothetical protein [Desulfogranum marinum]